MPSRLIRLGWSHLAIVASGILTVLSVVSIMCMPAWEDFYARELALPRLQQRYGFQFGTVKVSRDSVTHESWGIVRVTPDSEASRIGLRVSDVPFAFHGNGASQLYSALMAAERGLAAEVDVLNADDWRAGYGNKAFRTVHLRPRNAPY